MAKTTVSSFYQELRRRKVIRVAIMYALVAWMVVEVASVMFPGMLLPDWSVRLVIGLAVLGFPIALVLAWAMELTPDGLKTDASARLDKEADKLRASKHEPAKEGFDSIAVLPFVNLSNDPDNEYFSDGMSEELLNLLCKVPQLTVASRTSSFSFRGKDVDIGTVASQLGVDAIVEGSVRRSNDRVRISAQLIDGSTDRHLWSETYDRELKDVFAVQDEIAHCIVEALELNLSPKAQLCIMQRSATEDMVAYDYYLRGRYFVERGDVDSGQQMFEKAIQLDDNYALAWAGAADCHSWRCLWFGSTPTSRQQADECSLKALQLAPKQAEAHASRIMALTLNGVYPEAEAEFDAAIALDPQLYEAYYYGGRMFFAQGKYREAIDAFTQAGVVRPDDVVAASLKSTALKACGSKDEQEAAARHSINIADRYLALNPDDALALSRTANDLIYLGKEDEGIARAERALVMNPHVCRYNVACSNVLVGNIDRALELLETHARSGAVHLDWLIKDSDWDVVRDHPKFKAIVESLG
jgi:adenylate cyclase